MNDIVNDNKDHNIVNDSFAYKPDGLLVVSFLQKSIATKLTDGLQNFD